MPHKLELTFLGMLDVHIDGRPANGFRSIKAQALLCYLAVSGRMHSRSALSGLLWGDTPEEQARASLRQALSNLTELCAGCLTITRQTIAFDRKHPYSLDVERFEAAAARLAVSPGLVELYADLDLYRGDFLEGFYVRNAPDFETWLLGVRARYRELALQAFNAVAFHWMKSGDMAQAILYSRRMLEIEPWQEDAHRRLMQLLAQTGQRTAALEQYRLCQQLLSEELGVEPDEATQALYAEIKSNMRMAALSGTPRLSGASLRDGDPLEAVLLQQLGAQAAIHHRPLNVLTPRTNLPTSLTPFIGREEEMAAIQQRLSEPQCRLLTLVGPGGIGKTRLAIEVAAARQQAYRDGVSFVNLQPVPSAEALPVAIADALHIVLASAEAPQQQVQQYLADKALLLVLDNFEHLLDGATALAELLVAPDVQLLVTSREVLNLREEWLFWVEGIACPPSSPRHNGDDLGNYGAVRLFQEYAQRLQPAFALESNAAAVVRICQLSGGMPLALELAASWVKSLPCAEIAEELASGLAILSTPLRNIPERHRTMRVVFEQSWRRLGEQEQAVFQRLSIFRGGFRREAAQQVAGATLPVLSVLVDCCLLKQAADGRYQIHELLRQYGEERLAESPILETATHESYSAYFVAFLAERRFEFDGRGQLQAIQEIAEELENIRSAWRCNSPSPAFTPRFLPAPQPLSGRS
jgi:predicted ATPase/DNA-binding SARP family transcriptional activator